MFYCLTGMTVGARVIDLGRISATFLVPDGERSSARNDVINHCFKTVKWRADFSGDGAEEGRGLDLLSRCGQLLELDLGGPRPGRPVALCGTILSSETCEPRSPLNDKNEGSAYTMLLGQNAPTLASHSGLPSIRCPGIMG